MLRLAVSLSFARRARLVLSTAAIAIGVAFLAGTLLLTSALQSMFDGVSASAAADVDLEVRGRELGTAAATSGPARERLGENLVAEVRAVPEVAAAHGYVQGYAQVVGRDGKAVGSPVLPSVGMSWVPDDALNPYRIVDGREPTGDGEVVVDRLTAREGELAVGDVTSVVTFVGARPVTVVGIASFGTADSAAGSHAVLFASHTAQALFGLPDAFDSIRVRVAPGVDSSDAAVMLRDRLGSEVDVATAAEIVAENEEGFRAGLLPVRVLFTAISAISGVVALLVVSNSLSILVAQRARENATLRLIGASRRQVRRLVVVDAALAGLAGAIVGVVAGTGFAVALVALFGRLGLPVTVSAITMTPMPLVVAGAVGFATALAASLRAARDAGRTSPLVALRASLSDTQLVTRRRVITAGVLAAVGSIGVVVSLAVADAGMTMVAVAGGSIMALTGAVLAGPTVARHVTPLIGSRRSATVAIGAGLVGIAAAVYAAVDGEWVLAAVFAGIGGCALVAGRSGRTAVREFAVGSIVRQPRRVAAASTALAVGLLVVCTLAVVTSSLTHTLSRGFDDDVQADAVIAGSSFFGFSPNSTERVIELPDVAAHSPVRQIPTTIAGAAVEVAAVNAADISSVVDVGDIDGTLAGLTAGGIAVSADLASQLTVQVGSDVTIDATAGTIQASVVAVYERNRVLGDALVDIGLGERLDRAALDTLTLIRLDPDADRDRFLADANGVLAGIPDAEVVDRDDYIERQLGIFRQMILLLQALLCFAGAIGALGVANTLTLSVIERRNELGALRAIGMDRAQTRALVRWEATTIATLGTLLGIGAGTALGAALVAAIDGLDVQLPATQLAVIAGAALATGIVASIRPSRLATRVSILDSLAATT